MTFLLSLLVAAATCGAIALAARYIVKVQASGPINHHLVFAILALLAMVYFMITETYELQNMYYAVILSCVIASWYIGRAELHTQLRATRQEPKEALRADIQS